MTFLAELETNLLSHKVNLGKELRFLAFVHTPYLRDQFENLEDYKGVCMIFFLAWDAKRCKVVLMVLRSDPWSRAKEKVLHLDTMRTAEIKLPPLPLDQLKKVFMLSSNVNSESKEGISEAHLILQYENEIWTINLRKPG